MVLGSVAIAAWKPKLAPLMVIPYTVGGFADAFDGGLARRRASEAGTETTASGAVIDALADKSQEALTQYSLAIQNYVRGDTPGALLHIAAGVVAPSTALFRARAEADDIVVPEASLGSRPIRATLAGVDLALGRNRYVSRGLSIVSIGTSAITSVQRFQATQEGSKHNLGPVGDPAKVQAAKGRFKFLAGMTMA